jgi:hypothetical protein
MNPSDEQARSYHLALLLLIGDVEGCRRATRERLAAGLKDDDELSIAAQFLGQSPVAQPRKPDAPTDVTIDENNVHNQSTDTWSTWSRGVRAYVDGRFADTVNHLHQVPRLTEHPFFLTKNGFVLAMALHQMGQVVEARREFDAARKRLDGLGQAHGWRDSIVIEQGELMDYGWTEWVIATVLSREAEALVLYDPSFPADPFAPTALRPTPGRVGSRIEGSGVPPRRRRAPNRSGGGRSVTLSAGYARCRPGGSERERHSTGILS